MTDRDPCQGCRHLRTYSCPCQRPTCARHAYYGDARCRREPVSAAGQRTPGNDRTRPHG